MESKAAEYATEPSLARCLLDDHLISSKACSRMSSPRFFKSSESSGLKSLKLAGNKPDCVTKAELGPMMPAPFELETCAGARLYTVATNLPRTRAYITFSMPPIFLIASTNAGAYRRM